jgi:histidinol-phosphate aminotransferase
MDHSRRSFLRFVGAAGVLCASSSSANTQRGQEDVREGEPILLNRNENAYGTSPSITAAMREALTISNRFPDVTYGAAVRTIASFHGVRPYHVLLGCGSTDVMRMCAAAFLRPDSRLVTADPTFDVLQSYSRQIGCHVVQVPLTHRHEHDLDAMLARTTESTHLIYICNPNNPTGTITRRSDLEAFLAKVPPHVYVLIDEAYHHYAGISQDYASWIERAVAYPRLIVTRTFSKLYGLAGMRVGYAVASEPTIRQLMPYQIWEGMNMAGSLACTAALKDEAFVERAVKRNHDDRQEFFNQAQTRMLKPLDSHTNFYFMDVARPARDIIAHFQKHNIMIGPEFPSMSTFIRVTFGLPKQMLAFWRVWDLLPRGKMSM